MQRLSLVGNPHRRRCKLLSSFTFFGFRWILVGLGVFLPLIKMPGALEIIAIHPQEDMMVLKTIVLESCSQQASNHFH